MKWKLWGMLALILSLVLVCSFAMAASSNAVKATKAMKETSPTSPTTPAEVTFEYGVDKMTLVKGNTRPLPDAIGANGTWKVADDSIAVLKDKGAKGMHVKGKKVGDTELIYTVSKDMKIGKKLYKAGDEYKIKLYVLKKGAGVKKIKVPKKDKNITIETTGDTYTLAVSVKAKDPEAQKLFFYSNNEEVVSVSDGGKITALKPGATTITICATNMKAKTVRVKVLGGSPITPTTPTKA